ncbi:GntR family transcriptional regulator [Actinomyces sp. B33]|uniref:GntR family transcriptional regulator n=1 Tax=Actinomyces sp. B33 TaxID=2942131 RepID=UPI002340803D|nr:GntR family transcriptional regulator [Actinomyces sp. B33]MDC4232553.1 GntR family transcriptional regulator [Actinomyces sp. B33]
MTNSRRATKEWVASGKEFSLHDVPGDTKHEQLRNSLIKEIGRLCLTPGDALPSESGLCSMYDVSRAVVRQALEELESMGIIYRVHGKGSFVAERESAEKSPYTLRGLYADATGSEAVITSDVLSQKYVKADSNVAFQLNCAPGDIVFYLERVRRVDGEPWSWIHSYLPKEFGEYFAGRDMRTESMHKVLNENGVMVLGARRSIEVAPATEEQQRLLELGGFPVVMVLMSVNFDPAGNPIEYFTAYHRGNRSRFEFTL